MNSHKHEAERLLAAALGPNGSYWKTSDGRLVDGEAIIANAILALVEALEDAS